MLKDLLDAADGDLTKAQRGLIFVDEVDKIRKTTGKDSKDVNGSAVQQGLLRLVEGGVHRVSLGRMSDKTVEFINAPLPVSTLSPLNEISPVVLNSTNPPTRAFLL